MDNEKETIVCFCEDVTEGEIINAIKQGMTNRWILKIFSAPVWGRARAGDARRRL